MPRRACLDSGRVRLPQQLVAQYKQNLPSFHLLASTTTTLTMATVERAKRERRRLAYLYQDWRQAMHKAGDDPQYAEDEDEGDDPGPVVPPITRKFHDDLFAQLRAGLDEEEASFQHPLEAQILALNGLFFLTCYDSIADFSQAEWLPCSKSSIAQKQNETRNGQITKISSKLLSKREIRGGKSEPRI
jgi:hypothetical protein